MVATYDSQTLASGLMPSAEGVIPGYDDDVIPGGSDDAALADDEQVDAEASAEPESPFDLTTLDDEQRQWLDGHYQSQYSAQFDQRLAEAMRTRDRENNQLRQAQQQAESQQYALNAALVQAHRELMQIAQQTGDEVMFYKARDAIAGAGQGASAQQAQSQQQLVAWIANEHHALNQKLQADSVGPDGQRLFDPNDTEIQAARDEYIQAAYRDRSQWRPDGGLNVVANQEAKAASDRLSGLMKAKMLGGVRSQADIDRQAKAKAAADAKSRRAARGPQSTARGTGNGPVSGEAAFEMASKEYPNDAERRHARYLQLKYGNPQQ